MSSNGSAEMTGPKISSRAIRMSSRDVGEHGRRDEEAVAERALGEAGAAGQRARALLLAELEVAADAVELLGRDQRAELRLGIERVADAQRLARYAATRSTNSS